MSRALFPAAQSQRGASLLKVVILLLVALFVIFGAKLVYQKITYKPPYRKVGDQFMTAVTKNDAVASYALFSTNLKKQYTSDEWKQQLNSVFAGYTDKATYVRVKAIADTKNLYGTGANPQQLQYAVTVKGKKYIMYLTIFYEKNAWKVDQFDSAAV